MPSAPRRLASIPNHDATACGSFPVGSVPPGFSLVARRTSPPRRTRGSNRPPRSPEGASMVQRDGHISEAELAAFADGSHTSLPAAPRRPSSAGGMTERHRSLFVLLLVLGLIAASLAVVNQRDTKLGLDLQGGVQLVYEAEPTAQQPTVTPEALQRALDIMRDRVDALGVAEPELQRPVRTRSTSACRASRTPSAPPTRSARRPRCTSTTGSRTSSTRTARPTRSRSTGVSSRSAVSTTRSSARRSARRSVDNNNTTRPASGTRSTRSHAPLNDGIPEEDEDAA